jgi:Transglutaminase-like superfamily
MKQFYLLFVLASLSSCALLNITPSKRISKLSFDEDTRNPAYRFFFPNPVEDTLLIRLRKNYPLESTIKSAQNEQEKVLLAMAWVRQQWEHVGNHPAQTNNANTILERVKNGERFRCVEYGIVLKSVLNALNMPARTVGLKTRDVETTRLGAGHVLSEVWLKERQKWAMVDAQFDMMPVLDGIPLNAVELQRAIIEKRPFKFINSKGEVSRKEHDKYMRFIPHYLYYFNTVFDEKHFAWRDKFNIDGKANLYLIPKGAKPPTVFQRSSPIDDAVYTSSLADFYARPD